MRAQLTWSEPRPPSESPNFDHVKGYDHVIAETPFGRIAITWKGWKDHPSYDIDEAPNLEAWQARYQLNFSELEHAKQQAEVAYGTMLLEATLAIYKTPVTTEALRQTVQALIGPDHHIRELQYTRRLPVLSNAPANPIDVLLFEYTAAARHLQQGTIHGSDPNQVG